MSGTKLLAYVILTMIISALSPAMGQTLPICTDLNPSGDWPAGTRVELTGPSSGVTWTWLAVTAPGTLTKDGVNLPDGDYLKQNLVFDAAPGHYKISLAVYKTGYPTSCMDIQCVEFDVGPIACELCGKTFCQTAPMMDGSGTCAQTNPSVMTFPSYPGGTITYPGSTSSLNFKWYWNGNTPADVITTVTGSSLTINWADGIAAGTNPSPIPSPVPVGTYTIYLKVWAKGTTEPDTHTCMTTITKTSIPSATITKTSPP
jgi:hypothetical protein